MITKEERIRAGAKLDAQYQLGLDKKRQQEMARRQRGVNNRYHLEQPIQPLGHDVLVRPKFKDWQSSTGLILPATKWGKNRMVEAEVVRVGSLVSENINVNHRVLLWLLSGKDLGEYRIVHEDLIEAVIEGDDEIRIE